MGLLSGIVQTVKTVAKSIIKLPPIPGGPHPGPLPPIPDSKPGGLIKRFLDMLFGGGKNKKLAQDTAETDSYDSNGAKIEETIKIGEILNNYRKDIEEKADLLEENCLEESKRYFEYLIDELAQADDEDKFKLNTKRLKRYLIELEREIKGSLKKHVTRRISVADSDCLRILSMPKGKRKEKKMENYAEKVIREGLTELSSNLELIFDELNDYLESLFNEKIAEVIKGNEKRLAEVKELEEMFNQDRKEFKKKKADLNLTIDICEFAIDDLK